MIDLQGLLPILLPILAGTIGAFYLLDSVVNKLKNNSPANK